MTPESGAKPLTILKGDDMSKGLVIMNAVADEMEKAHKSKGKAPKNSAPAAEPAQDGDSDDAPAKEKSPPKFGKKAT